MLFRLRFPMRTRSPRRAERLKMLFRSRLPMRTLPTVRPCPRSPRSPLFLRMNSPLLPISAKKRRFPLPNPPIRLRFAPPSFAIRPRFAPPSFAIRPRFAPPSPPNRLRFALPAASATPNLWRSHGRSFSPISKTRTDASPPRSLFGLLSAASSLKSLKFRARRLTARAKGDRINRQPSLSVTRQAGSLSRNPFTVCAAYLQPRHDVELMYAVQYHSHEKYFVKEYNYAKRSENAKKSRSHT